MNTVTKFELAEVKVATGAGKRVPADLADFTSLETFVTDDDGNTVSRTTSAGTVSYTWDDFNNLLSVALENGQTTENTYDAGSIREEMTKDSGEKVRSFYSGMPTVNDIAPFTGGPPPQTAIPATSWGTSFWATRRAATGSTSSLQANGVTQSASHP